MKSKTEILRKFRTSIRCGTGRAYILQHEHPEIDFTNEIFKASIKNYAYDGQSEGDRTYYLLQFIRNLNSKQANLLKNKLVKRLFQEKDDTWNLQQIFNICGFFAVNDIKVKKAIYKRFKQTPIKDSDWLGMTIILKLDGIKGMLNIAEHLGKRLIDKKDEHQDDWIVQSFNDENPETKIRQVLKKEAESNPYIKAYLKEIESTRKRWDKLSSNRKKWDLERIIDHILDDNKRGPIFTVINKLNKREIKQIGKLLNSNVNNITVEKLLYIFTIVEYPFNHNNLKLYLRKIYPSRIRAYALDALSNFTDEDIKTIAVNKLKTTNKPSVFLDVLKTNYNKGDSKLITQVIDRFNDEHIIENIAISLCDVYEKNPTKDCKKPLMKLYSKMNCAIHRNSILEILSKNEVLPKSILKEMEFDSDENIRKLYKKIRQQ